MDEQIFTQAASQTVKGAAEIAEKFAAKTAQSVEQVEAAVANTSLWQKTKAFFGLVEQKAEAKLGFIAAPIAALGLGNLGAFFLTRALLAAFVVAVGWGWLAHIKHEAAEGARVATAKKYEIAMSDAKTAAERFQAQKDAETEEHIARMSEDWQKLMREISSKNADLEGEITKLKGNPQCWPQNVTDKLKAKAKAIGKKVEPKRCSGMFC